MMALVASSPPSRMAAACSCPPTFPPTPFGAGPGPTVGRGCLGDSGGRGGVWLRGAGQALEQAPWLRFMGT